MKQLQIYKSIEELDSNAFRHIIAGAFFQMQKSCMLRVPEINTLVSGEILYVDVLPAPGNHQVILSKQERQNLLKQLGAEHYLPVSVASWPQTLGYIRKRNKGSNGIYKGPFFLSGLNETGTDLHLMQSFLTFAFSDTSKFEWHHKLGYFYPLCGEVVYGNQMGRRMGYPTLNIKPLENQKLIPPMGVYSGLVKHKGNWYQSMINIGIRPTLDLDKVTIEAHVFEFSGEIYGDEVTLHFTGRIRDEMKFPSLDSLKTQLKADQKAVLTALNTMNIDTATTEEFLLYK